MTTRVTRFDYDSGYGGFASVRIERVPDSSAFPYVSELPEDIRRALAEWVGLPSEVDRLQGKVERLEVEKAALVEQLIQAGSDPS